MLLVVAVVILPLSLIRELSALRFTSILAVVSMVHRPALACLCMLNTCEMQLFVALAVLIRGGKSASTHGIEYATLSFKLFSSTTIIFFAYNCRAQQLCSKRHRLRLVDRYERVQRLLAAAQPAGEPHAQSHRS